MFLASACLAGITRMCAFRTVTNDSAALRTATRTHRRWENRHWLDPFRMLRAERIMHIALKFPIPGNFSRGRWRICRVHQLAPDVLAVRKRIEDPIPTSIRIKDRHVEDQHGVVLAAQPAKPAPRSRDFSFVGICRFHLCVFFQWYIRNTPSKPNNTPMMGLRRANQSEKFHPAIGPEFVFVAIISSRRLVCESTLGAR